MQDNIGLLRNFSDDYGGTYTITGNKWMYGTKVKYRLLQYNKAENCFIAKLTKLTLRMVDCKVG
jgi:hypothetical protein